MKLEIFWSELRKALVNRHSVKTSIGQFYLNEFEGYEGRNPRTGQIIQVPPKYLPFFVPNEFMVREVFQNTQALAPSEYLLELERPLPFTDTYIDCLESGIILNGLRKDGEYEENSVGLFSLRQTMICFSPSEDLRQEINAKV